ncbi:MAG: enoyl-CoA hydratase/isomerase family protein [Salinirussus sp.]
MSFEHLHYDVRNHTAEITLCREPVNAINLDLASEVTAAYRRARDDDTVRSVILTSEFERAFSAGMDLDMAHGASGLELRRFLETFYMEMHDLQYRMGKPTIAALTGPARAAGVTLAVSCDVLVASDTASLAYPEIDVGVIPAMHFVHLPRQIGRHRAFELLFTGKSIDAAEAERLGLYNRVVPADSVLEEARTLAATFNEKSSLVTELARDAYVRANDRDYRRTIENVVDTLAVIAETDDAKEGLAAFAEDREPEWPSNV